MAAEKPERMTTVETEKDQQTPEKRSVCLQRADAEVFLAYRKRAAQYAAILILLFFLLLTIAGLEKALKWKDGPVNAILTLGVLAGAAVFIVAMRQTSGSRRQFAFFKKVSFRVEAGLYDELSARAKAFAPQEWIGVACLCIVLLTLISMWLGLYKLLSDLNMAILTGISGLLLAAAAWFILIAKSYRVLLQRGEYSALNKASRGRALPFGILCGVAALIVSAATDMSKIGRWATVAAIGIGFALYTWRRICLNRQLAALKQLDAMIRTDASSLQHPTSKDPR